MLEMVGVCFGLIGAIAALWYFREKLFPFRRLSWRCAERTSERIALELIAEDYSPTLIMGIGRGGAIFGALISGCLGHRPLIVVDREYRWRKDGRFENLLFPIDIPQTFLERVLIVSGEVHSGNTMRTYCRYCNDLGAKSVRHATLYYEEGSTMDVEYKGVKSEKKNVLMPWMFASQYIRADRCPKKTT